MVKRFPVVLTLMSFCFVLSGHPANGQDTQLKPLTPEPTEAQPADTTKQELVQPTIQAEADQGEEKKSDVIASEHLLPAATKAWLSVRDADELERRFHETQFGMLFEKESLKPFADHLRSRVKDWVDKQNVRLNLNMENLHGVHSGEICFAGVLPEDAAGDPVAGQHGLVFLMDVSNTQQEARELQVKINAELVKRGAEQKVDQINGVEYTRSVIDKPELFRQKRFNFQAIVKNWMVVSNNEAIFRDMIRRLNSPEKIQEFETLGGQVAFKTVMARSSLGKEESQIRWFIDPFGYMELAQQIRDDEALSKVPRDNTTRDLKENGFDVFRGIGGNIAIATGSHDILHRTFNYAKREAGKEKVLDLFDFTANNAKPLKVPAWVPADASSIVQGNWDLQKALDSAGQFYDAVVGEKEGDFDRMLNDLKFDPNLELDLRKLIGLMDNHMVLMTATELPIATDSERAIGGVRIKGEPEFVIQSLSRIDPAARIIKLGQYTAVEIDPSIEPETTPDLPTFDDPFNDQDFDVPGEAEEEQEEKFQLFEKRYFVVARVGEEMYLLVANNKNYLRQVLESNPFQFEQSDDFQNVKNSLGLLVDLEKTNWQTFSRLDSVLRTNYEMLRRNEMGQSQTMLARLINQAVKQQRIEQARLEGKEIDPDQIRNQELDGTTLPSDFDQDIAPYLGPTGSVIESEKDGWRITGVVLPKKDLIEMVRKIDEVEGNSDSSDKR